MNKIKRIVSSLLIMFIFMNHIIPFLHSLAHQDDFTAISSSTLKFEQNSFSNGHHCFFDICFGSDYSQLQSLSYLLVIPNNNSNYILDKEKQLIATVLFRKKSRSPPPVFSA